MALKVIGPGFGRTGTLSLKLALEMLGFTPCFHMSELIHHPEDVPPWRAATDGESVEWDAVFNGYLATVDWPAAYFWRELAAHYPQAKVVLTVRDPEHWYESFSNTIYVALTTLPPHDSPQYARRVMATKLIHEKTFAGRSADRAYVIGVYERHNEEVRRGIPADRLLVYEVGAGWEPLCNFLACSVPQEPFPKTNSTEEFQARLAAINHLRSPPQQMDSS